MEPVFDLPVPGAAPYVPEAPVEEDKVSVSELGMDESGLEGERVEARASVSLKRKSDDRGVLSCIFQLFCFHMLIVI